MSAINATHAIFLRILKELILGTPQFAFMWCVKLSFMVCNVSKTCSTYMVYAYFNFSFNIIFTLLLVPYAGAVENIIYKPQRLIMCNIN